MGIKIVHEYRQCDNHKPGDKCSYCGYNEPIMKKPTLQNIVRHDRDCSCYVVGSVICDCGALLKELRKDYFCTGRDDLWEIWMEQVDAVGRTAKEIRDIDLWISQL